MAPAYTGADAYLCYGIGGGGGSSITKLVANDAAFAGIDAQSGGVIAFGSAAHGGNLSDLARFGRKQISLSSGVSRVVASAGAFAALNGSGSVYAWGSLFAGGGVSTWTRPDLVNITSLTATRTAFAALTSTGNVVTFGDKYGGGDSSAVAAQLNQNNVYHILGAQSVFVAFRRNDSVVVWGNSYYGGDASAVASQLVHGDGSSAVQSVAYTAAAFAALKFDGTVVTWGKSGFGGDSSAVQSTLTSVVAVYSTHSAFAALKADGSVAWGDAKNGGEIPVAGATASKLSSGVTAIYATRRAFAALKAPAGEVVLWGSMYHGGDADATTTTTTTPGAGSSTAGTILLLSSGVVRLCSNDVAFTAVKSDGSAVVWGHAASIPFPGVLDTPVSLINATCSS